MKISSHNHHNTPSISTSPNNDLLVDSSLKGQIQKRIQSNKKYTSNFQPTTTSLNDINENQYLSAAVAVGKKKNFQQFSHLITKSKPLFNSESKQRGRNNNSNDNDNSINFYYLNSQAQTTRKKCNTADDKKIKNNNQHASSRQENILQYQSSKHPGFYTFQAWQNIHRSHYNHVTQTTMKTFWKILRIINYGEVLIPSGLVFDICKILDMSVKEKHLRGLSLKKTLNGFLKLNVMQDTVDSFRQLRLYPSLRQIQQQYEQNTSIIDQRSAQCIKNNKKFKSNSSSNSNNNHQNSKPTHSQENVFERIYQDAKYRNQTRTQQVYQGLIKKQMPQQNAFQPKINQYYPKKLFIDQQEQTNRPVRFCDKKDKWKTKNQKQEEEAIFISRNFRSGKIDESIYDHNQIETIPGASQHINRQKYSQAKRQRKQRFFNNPTFMPKFS